MDPVTLIEGFVGLTAGFLKSARFGEFSTWSQKAKSVFVVLGLLLFTILVGCIVTFTSHAFLPLILLGIVYGVFLSYPAMKFLGPKIQAAIAGFLGGVGLGSLGAKEAALKSGIQSLASAIGDLEATVRQALVPQGQSSQPPPWTYVDSGIVYCVWMTLLTAFLVVAANACLGEMQQQEAGKQAS